LAAISNSPIEPNRVFAEIAASAARLCDATDTAIFQVDTGALRLVAHHGPHGAFEVGQFTVPLAPEFVHGRAALQRQSVHIADLLAEAHEYPEGSKLARHLGHRTGLVVPLMRAGKALGTIGIFRNEVRPFGERQVQLLKTFADQAVIAIENTRLFKEMQARTWELQEVLEYQTATSEVLNVISRSPTDAKPVFESIVRSAANLFEPWSANISILRNGMFHFEASASAKDGDARFIVERASTVYPIPFDPITSPSARAIVERRIIELLDTTSPETPEMSKRVQAVTGFRSMTFVPLLREHVGIGTIILTNREPGYRLTEKQRALVQTFADQAVIAIENTRLFDEVQARTRDLAKTIADLEIASHHKSQFVANMSHELRTPLAAILGFAELIQEGFYGPLPDKSMDALSRIRSNGKHLLGLINSVLDIAKIESGQFSLNLAEYSLESVVETVRAGTESLAETKKLALKTEVPNGLPVGLGDEQRLTQVLLNLVGNAIKFTDAGEVRIVVTVANGHFAVRVTDTGPGISEEHQARIFEQFHQVDSSLTKSKGGTGLGLAIAKQIVEMHGGRLWVQSTLGKGATFQMELPTIAQSGDQQFIT